MLVSEMLAEIRDHGFDDLTDTRLLGFINDAYWNVALREAWPFLEEQAVPTFDSSGKLLTPTDVFAVKGLFNTTSGVNLEPMRRDEFRRRHGMEMTQTGDAQLYYFVGRSLYIWPVPSSPTLVLDYVGTPAALTVTPDATPILPEPFHRLVVLGALVRCYMLEDDPENAQLFRGFFEENVSQIRSAMWFRQYDRTDRIYDVDEPDPVDWLY